MKKRICTYCFSFIVGIVLSLCVIKYEKTPEDISQIRMMLDYTLITTETGSIYNPHI